MMADSDRASNTEAETPNPARIYDYLLGGHHNFAADRAAAEQVIATNPDARLAAQLNRVFLRRAVQFLLAHGIDQYLDIGSGIPAAGNIHEIVSETNPAAHVVYVDSDGIAVRYSEALLRDVPTAIVVQADARQPRTILDHPAVQRQLDFTRPVGVLLVAVLHFLVDDAEAERTVKVLRDAMVPGSYLVVSHGTDEPLSQEIRDRMHALYTRSTNPVKLRSRATIAHYFDELEFVEPGLVYVPRWRPDGINNLLVDQPERSAVLAGVGRKG